MATVLDCFSKKVVGCAMAEHMRTELVTDALAIPPAAPHQSDPGPGSVRLDGQVGQRPATTTGQKTLLAALELPEPPKFFDFIVHDR